MHSRRLNETKEWWCVCVCLSGNKRGSICGTKATLRLCKLEQGNQVRGVESRDFDD